MDTGVSVGQLLLAILCVVATGGVAWGALLQRVRALEREVAALAGFGERLARIEEQVGYIREEVGKITSSWLLAPPAAHERLRPVRKS